MLRLLPKEMRFFELFESHEKARHIKVLETQADHIAPDILSSRLRG